jgi:PAS domain S-box-containing protein
MDSGEIGELGYRILLRPLSLLQVKLKLTELRDCRSASGGESDYQYRDLFLNHNDAILIHNSEGKIFEANPQAARLLGGNDGNPANSFLRDYEPSEFTGIFAEMIEGTRNRGVVRLEVVLQNARNAVFSAEAFTGRISGERDEFYTVIRDISQRKMIEDKFKHRLNMESAMSLIAAHFISNENPREKLLEGLEQIGQLCEADSVRMEFYDRGFLLFDEPSLSWYHRRKITGELSVSVDTDMRAEILEELKDREYVYTESWQGQRIPRLFVIPLRYDGNLISALWIHQPDRPLVYEDRILFVMIGEMFRSYYVQQVSDGQRRQLIRHLERKVNQLNCLFGINHMLQEEHEDLMAPLRRAALILFENLSADMYHCVEVVMKDQEFCAGTCPRDFHRGDPEYAELVAFSRASEYFDFSMEVYLTRPGELPEEDAELIQAVYYELNGFLKQAHLRLQRSLMEIQLRHTQRIEAMGQLASGIAHEMNTPNQYIQDNLNFIRESLDQITPLGDELMELLEACEREIRPLAYEDAQRILKALRELEMPFLIEEMPTAIEQSLEGVKKQRGLIDAMRSYSHPGSSGQRSPHDINRIIREALVLSKYEWVRVARVELDLDEDIPEIPCFPQDLSQVFINIIVNAAHAIAERFPPGQDPGRPGQSDELPGVIRIHSRFADGMAEISIGDNGTGIGEDLASRIFEPFYTTKEVGKGTGQGLAIAYEIIENRHKGQILLHSEPGGGSEFRLILPSELTAGDTAATSEERS